jgi:hypothetical protein
MDELLKWYHSMKSRMPGSSVSNRCAPPGFSAPNSTIDSFELHHLIVGARESPGPHAHTRDIVLTAIHQKKFIELRASVDLGPDPGGIAAVDNASALSCDGTTTAKIFDNLSPIPSRLRRTQYNFFEGLRQSNRADTMQSQLNRAVLNRRNDASFSYEGKDVIK